MNATASGKPSGGAYTWSTASSNVSLTNVNSATVTATAVNASASQNDTTLTVKYVVNNDTNCSNPNDCSTASMNITVSKPTSLSLIDDNTNPSGHTCNASAGSNDCSESKFTGTGSYTSYLRTRDYHIMDQFNNWIQGYAMQIQESYTPPTGQCASDEVNTDSGNGDTATDCFYFCSATCQGSGSCGVSSTQTVTVNGFQVATKSVGWSCSGATVTP